jgi:BASS family bile acid:Na+ symporter
MEDSVFSIVLLPAALAVIMVSLGMHLTTADFRRIVVQPRGIAIGIANLAIVSPLLAFGIAELFGLEAALAVGLVLLGASPGGTMANLLTHLARGDTALSISITGISSVAAVITVPLFLTVAIDHFGAGGLEEDPNMIGVALRALLITVVPLSIGMWLRANRSGWVERRQDAFQKIAFGVFLAIVVGVIAAENERVTENFGEVAGACIALNLAAMAISFTVSRLARLDDRQSTAIAIELGVHNTALAIAVGASIATVLTIPAAVYASFMFITAGLFARLMHRRNSRGVEGSTPAESGTPA